MATGLVTVIIAITKFTHGAWAIMLLVPLLVAVLVRLNHQYESESRRSSLDPVELADGRGRAGAGRRT